MEEIEKKNQVRNFLSCSIFLGIFCICFVSISFLTQKHVLALGVVDDLTTRAQIATVSNHTFHFGIINGLTQSGDKIEIVFDLANQAFNLSGLALGDLDLTDNVGPLTLAGSPNTDTWGADINTTTDTITLTAPTDGTNGYVQAFSAITMTIGNHSVYQSIGVNQILNPADAGSYGINIIVTSQDGVETAFVSLSIVDSDQVTITGDVNAMIAFDIDVGTSSDVDCDYNACLSHSNGSITSNYTIDLGELNVSWVNKSNDIEVMHSDNKTGSINSLYMDLTSNAPNGVSVIISSVNGGLKGSGSNIIDPVTDGDTIEPNSGKYGFNMPEAGSTEYGNFIRNSFCDQTTTYCGLTADSKEVFSTNNDVIQKGRIRLDIGVSPKTIDNPGSYSDGLTVIAVPNF